MDGKRKRKRKQRPRRPDGGGAAAGNNYRDSAGEGQNRFNFQGMSETATATGGSASDSLHEFRLESGQELRFEVEGNEQLAILELKTGFAELFGTELMRNKKYEFKAGSKVAVFTWHGCCLQLTGENIDTPYVARETPMTFYLNIHGCLENMRDKAGSEDVPGPIVMVCGPTDVGKTTLTRILANYAVRRNRNPILVDIDVGQGSIGIPSTMGANVIERTADVEQGFSRAAPVLLHFGATTPDSNIVLYDLLIKRLAEIVGQRGNHDKKVKYSGVLINTCGWVKGAGYQSLLQAAQAFEVDVMLVLDQERLYNELVRDLPRSVKVILTPKSGGVVVRSRETRNESRDSRIREYFYGLPIKAPPGAATSGGTQYYPHSYNVPFAQLKILKIGAPNIPDSCMPIGMKANDNQTKMVPIPPTMQILHHILTVVDGSSADRTRPYEATVLGFLCVTAVDMERQMVTVLSREQRFASLPPNALILLSEIQFMDSQ